jgi:hypothetical protein
MHCDYLNVTVPDTHSHSVLREITALLIGIGAVRGNEALWRLGSGTLRIEPKRGFVTCSASGAVLESLRAADRYMDYLSVFADGPHRVTKMDIALDRYHDLSAPILCDVYDRATGSGIALTRKRIQPQHVRKLFSPGADGVDTGTVYLGARTSEVRARVYDKQHQLQGLGVPCPTPITRYELTITDKSGASLRVAAEPEPAFWHYMSGVLPAPSNVLPFVRETVGFDLPKRVGRLPAALLAERVASSAEIGLLLDLAGECGPHGLDYLLRQIRKRHARDSSVSLAS